MFHLFLACAIYACNHIARFNLGDKAHIGRYVNGSRKDTPPNSIDQDIPILDKPFMIAVRKDDIVFFKEVFQHGMSLNEVQNIIHSKGCSCRKKLAGYLYEYSNSIYNKTDQYGNTVLHTASKNGNSITSFRFLDPYKNLPLFHQYKTIVVGLEIKNNAGETPFHLAASEGHILFVQVLLDQLNQLASLVSFNPNQDINSILSIKNNNELTALDIAAIRNNTEMVELLYPENYYTCGACNESFRLPNDLVKHKSIHTKKILHKCETCGKSCMKPSQLKVHIRTHTGERPHECDKCDKRFKQKCHLTVHMRNHTGERPYKCNKCSKAFITTSNLSAHEKTHTGEKPHKCEQCDKTFITISSLKRHKKIHTKEKQHKCDQCNRTFAIYNNLKRHKKIHTGE